MFTLTREYSMKVLERNFDKGEIRKSFRNVVWFYDVWNHLTESKAAKEAWKF
jgi:ubiquinone/menaquinone biosynthesis C-methylase UbiE